MGCILKFLNRSSELGVHTPSPPFLLSFTCSNWLMLSLLLSSRSWRSLLNLFSLILFRTPLSLNLFLLLSFIHQLLLLFHLIVLMFLLLKKRLPDTHVNLFQRSGSMQFLMGTLWLQLLRNLLIFICFFSGYFFRILSLYRLLLIFPFLIWILLLLLLLVYHPRIKFNVLVPFVGPVMRMVSRRLWSLLRLKEWLQLSLKFVLRVNVTP